MVPVYAIYDQIVCLADTRQYDVEKPNIVPKLFHHQVTW